MVNGDIKHIIKETKNRHELNGDVTNKDLILYLLNKQDTEFNWIKERFNKGQNKIGWNRSAIKWVSAIGTTFGTGITAVLAWILIKLYNII